MVTTRMIQRQRPDDDRAELAAARLRAAVLQFGELAWRECSETQGAAGSGRAFRTETEWLEWLRSRWTPSAEDEAETAPRRSVVGGGALLIGLLLLLSAAIVGSATTWPVKPAASDTPAGASGAADSPAAVPDVSALPTATAVPAPTPTKQARLGAGADETSASADGCVDANGARLPAGSWLCRGQVIFGTPPSTGATTRVEQQLVASRALDEQAPPYRTINSVRSGPPGRVRLEVNIVVPATYTREETIAVLTDAGQRTRRQKPEVKVVGVFAYTSLAGIGRRFDKGRALVSRDGSGWTGDRTFDPVARGVADDGTLQITLGSVLSPSEQLAVSDEWFRDQ
jgi:hypothetical protein